MKLIAVTIMQFKNDRPLFNIEGIASFCFIQRIEILMMIGQVNRVRTQQELFELFKFEQLDRPITQSLVNKVERKIRETSTVDHHSKINEEAKLNFLLVMKENPTQHLQKSKLKLRYTSCNWDICFYADRSNKPAEMQVP